MILSHRHRFIFLKTGKTAGTSVELLLRKACGPDDVITPVTPDDEELARAIGAPGPQHWEPRRRSPSDWSRQRVRRLLRRPPRRPPSTYWNHMPAAVVREVVGDDIWQSYHKVSIERDPWDKVVSTYYWSTRRGGRDRAALERACRNAGKGWGIYTIDGEIVVDTMLHYEHLEDDLRRLFAHLGIDLAVELPRAKAGVRPEGLPATRVLTDADATVVAEAARREIEAFGYRWPGSELG